ncbi:hypothetical protein CANARDRAFT_27070 [[Candida] arabinofermentans NRRL YB-2248]|uniref:Zn(2)-C6 fungal-type domain-containing protein n=1 Tax=[Candida] arabinofermentans NRRL YB-2248 TaxID=983967 RepID=A0A1E4T4F0_9ASCO|nr:hypothetical protein CANARDRAFT_27070 [[Candida] arabinofermentans NRRL YB-2248]
MEGTEIDTATRKRQLSSVSDTNSQESGAGGDNKSIYTDLADQDKANDLAAKRRRLRAARACIVCHDRKVKCDVSLKELGEKCSNCRDFGSQCVLYERKKRASKKDKLVPIVPSVTVVLDATDSNNKFGDGGESGGIGDDIIKKEQSQKINLAEIDNTYQQQQQQQQQHHHQQQQQQQQSPPPPQPPTIRSSFKPASNTQKKNSRGGAREIKAQQTKNNTNYNNGLPDFITPNYQNELPHISAIKLDPQVVLKTNFESLVRKEYLISNNSAAFMNEIIDELIEENKAKNRTRAYNLDEYDFQMLNLFGCFSIPNHETSWKYIHNYFEILNPQFPIIDKKKFYEDYKDLNNPPSLLLLFSVLYVGARHSDEVNSTQTELIELDKTCKILFKRAKLLFDYSIESEPIPLVQSILCFIWNYENFSMFSKNDYYWTKIAIGYAQQFGFHRNLDEDEYLSVYEKRMYRRLWWLLFIKDKLVGLGFGKPFMINLDDCDVLMLTDEDLHDSDMSRLEIDYLINFIKFAELVSNVVKEQSKMNKLMANGKPILPLLKQCDMMMIKWLSGVPYHLKYRLDDESTQSVLSAILTSQYYTLLILLHKSNIHRNMADQYPSWAISFQAAQMVKLMCDTMVDRGMILHISLISHNTLYSAAIVMLYQSINKDQQIARISSQFFLSIFKVWKMSATKWPTCYPMSFIFNMIYHDEKKKQALVDGIIDKDATRSKNSMLINTNNVMLPHPSQKHSSLFGDDSNSNLDLSIPSIAKIKLSSHREETAYNNDLNNNNNLTNSSSKLKSMDSLNIDLEKLFTNNVFSQSKTLLPKININTINKNSDQKNDSQQNNTMNDNQSFENGNDEFGGQNKSFVSSEMPVSLWLMNTSWKPDFQTGPSFNSPPPNQSSTYGTPSQQQQQQQPQQQPPPPPPPPSNNPPVSNQNQMYQSGNSPYRNPNYPPHYMAPPPLNQNIPYGQQQQQQQQPPPPPPIGMTYSQPTPPPYYQNNQPNNGGSNGHEYQGTAPPGSTAVQGPGSTTTDQEPVKNEEQSQMTQTQMAHLLTQLSQHQPHIQHNNVLSPQPVINNSSLSSYPNQSQFIPPPPSSMYKSTPPPQQTRMILTGNGNVNGNNRGVLSYGNGTPNHESIQATLPNMDDNDTSYPSSTTNPYKFFKFY